MKDDPPERSLQSLMAKTASDSSRTQYHQAEQSVIGSTDSGHAGVSRGSLGLLYPGGPTPCTFANLLCARPPHSQRRQAGGQSVF